MRRAIVYCHDIEAGLLEEATPGRGYTFTYDKQYMMNRTHDPVSLTMPFREEPYQSDYLFPVFTNMLPEGANRKIVCRSWRLDEKDFANRKIVCRSWRLDEKDFFGLLLKIATYDTIGAITVKEVES